MTSGLPTPEHRTRATLLRHLPDAEYDALEAHLAVVRVESGDVVAEEGEPLDTLYFPLTCVFSLVTRDAEVTTVGNEGVVGLPVFLGMMSSPNLVTCQTPGRALTLRAATLNALLTRSRALHRTLNRYTQATMIQLARDVVCAAEHTPEQREARWALTTRDRVGTGVGTGEFALPDAATEAASCECYRVVRDTFERLLGR